MSAPRRTKSLSLLIMSTTRKHNEVKVEKKALLKLLRGKLEGDHTASELEEPLEYNNHCKSSAVLVATSEIDINGVKVTKLASKILAKQAGLSLDALSHCMLISSVMMLLDSCFRILLAQFCVVSH